VKARGAHTMIRWLEVRIAVRKSPTPDRWAIASLLLEGSAIRHDKRRIHEQLRRSMFRMNHPPSWGDQGVWPCLRSPPGQETIPLVPHFRRSRSAETDRQRTVPFWMSSLTFILSRLCSRRKRRVMAKSSNWDQTPGKAAAALMKFIDEFVVGGAAQAFFGRPMIIGIVENSWCWSDVQHHRSSIRVIRRRRIQRELPTECPCRGREVAEARIRSHR